MRDTYDPMRDELLQHAPQLLGPYRLMSGSALDLLKPRELCGLVLKDGAEREGEWSPWNRGWYFTDKKEAGFVHLDGVDEWWPASVPF